MTLPVSGAISFNAINVELGVAGTTQANINQTSYRTLAGVPSGTIALSNFYGKSNRVTSNITISANTTNYTLNTAKVTGYAAGTTDVTLTINAGVYVYSTSTGTAALIVNTSWAAGDTVKIVNNGTIVGKGGDGGTAQNNGTGGGLGLLVQRATTITNNSRIAGGGGGGGGGASISGFDQNCAGASGTGGGGGGGIGNGLGNGGGNNGTLTSAGSWGGGNGASGSGQCGESSTVGWSMSGGPGGDGGTYGTAGGNGGGASSSGGCCSAGGTGSGAGGGGGGAVSGNANITWLAFGTRNGAIT